jgi:hypothetical protein
MRYPTLLGLGLSVLTLLAAVVPAGTQTKTEPIDEKLFAAYILDNMYQNALPRPDTSNRYRPPPYVELAAFVAHRRVVFDTLRRYYEKKKLDPALFELYKDYGKELEVWGEFHEKVLSSLQAYDRTMALGQMAASQAVWNTGLAYGLATFLGGASGEEALLTGWLKAAQAAAVARQQLTRLQMESLRRVETTFGDAGREFEPRILEIRKKNYPHFKEVMDELRAKHDWKDAEFAYDRALATAPTGTEPSRNPFRIAAAARAFLANKSAGIEELLEQAAACQRAADLVPAAKLYDYYRASFLGIGGTLANRAALKDLGAAGFVTTLKNPAKGSATAMKIWQRYLACQGAVNDQVIRSFIQACGCGGKPVAAYQLVAANAFQLDRFRRPLLNGSFSCDPAFWYDSARIASLMGQAGVSMQCLEQAVRLGFRDFEAAKVDPDLGAVREHPSTTRQFKAVIR